MVAARKSIPALVYKKLLQFYGPQHWWPAQTKFEVIVGAILTQNTSWSNVELAITNLKKAKLLSAPALHKLSTQRIASLIRPAGYFNVKAKRLKNFLKFFFDEYQASIKAMQKEDLSVLRKKLLEINGIGPETADSILLYALDKPVFVVDSYTKRIFSRHKVVSKDDDYHRVQQFFSGHLQCKRALFNEYHALIVMLGKDFCRTNARCQQCPLNFLNTDKQYKHFRYAG